MGWINTRLPDKLHRRLKIKASSESTTLYTLIPELLDKGLAKEANPIDEDLVKLLEHHLNRRR